MPSHRHLTRTRVQEHALVFEWEGSDKSLKPLLLMGHQGVSAAVLRVCAARARGAAAG